MIISIDSDLPTFKTVHFRRGLNVLLSDKSPDSGEKQTRNSAGKTSLVELIHFLFGANATKDSLLRNPALAKYTFRARIEFDEGILIVGRSGSEPSRILVSMEDAATFRLKGKFDRKSGVHYVTNEVWKEFLGARLFGLPLHLEGSAFGESNAPSFRALFAYFVRRGAGGAFLRPEQQSEKQQRSDWQINLSYLLGLDWRIPFELHNVREREKQLEELRKAAKSGALGEVIGTVAELRPKLVLAEANAKKLSDDIANFHVVESYHEYSDRAARARSQMLAIERRAIPLKEAAAHLRDALARERAPEPGDLSRLYESVGVELPGVALRRFEEVAEFHASVIENRRHHLLEEIAGINKAIADGDERVAKLNAERSSILHFLSGAGALEDFLTLQKKLADLEAEAASLKKKFETAELIEGEATKLNIDRANIQRRLQEDHQVRRDRIENAIIIIGNAISNLYEDRTGEFVVDATENGPEFSITIQGDRGAGISSMEIFCFDLALFEITGQEKRGPRFLIHDSHLYDGVDERQIAQALHLGSNAAELIGGQYIVMMNSDIFDRLPHLDTFDRNAAVLATRLSDETDTGGLFGFRFD
ncbi:MAG TPA: ABC-three component system protein [Rhizomicrobium sp.]|nr:ABC-three component system protein [Rhizomicrobium sp.]